MCGRQLLPMTRIDAPCCGGGRGGRAEAGIGSTKPAVRPIQFSTLVMLSFSSYDNAPAICSCFRRCDECLDRMGPSQLPQNASSCHPMTCYAIMDGKDGM